MFAILTAKKDNALVLVNLSLVKLVDVLPSGDTRIVFAADHGFLVKEKLSDVIARVEDHFGASLTRP